MEQKIFFNGEVKAAGTEKGIFEGYASTFGNVDKVDDIVEYGAFAESLRKREPKVLMYHKMSRPVGKLIEAREDNKGLYVKVKLSLGTTDGKDAYEFIKDGVLDRLSIGFLIKEAEYEGNIRIVKEVELLEFSLVTIPANDMAEITGVKNAPLTEREFEKFLRDNGYDRTAAKAITSHGYKGYQNVLRDAGIDTPNDDLRDADEAVKTLSNILQTLKGESNDRTTRN